MQDDGNFSSIAINLSHLPHLLCFLRRIDLIDAQGVNPEEERLRLSI